MRLEFMQMGQMERIVSGFAFRADKENGVVGGDQVGEAGG
jgi:hypothetical protein